MSKCCCLLRWLACLGVLAPASPAQEPDEQSIERPSVKRLGHLQDTAIDESSGLALSRAREGIFYTHNDSGDRPRLFAFDRDGVSRGTFTLAGAKHIDWEDMAAATRDGKNLLVVADVGDNEAQRRFVTLYVVEEPTGADAALALESTIHFIYADGPRDCEAVAVDPTTGDILLAAKGLDLFSDIYRLRWPRRPSLRPLVAEKYARIEVPLITGMDISPDGTRLVACTYTHAAEFVRQADEAWQAALARKATVIVLPIRRQGESICYGADGRSLYLTSEKLPTPLLELPRE